MVHQDCSQSVDSGEFHVTLAHIQRQQLVTERTVQHINQMSNVKVGYSGLAQTQVLKLLTVAQNGEQDTGVVATGANAAAFEADVAQIAPGILEERSQRNFRRPSISNTGCERPLQVEVASIRVVHGFNLDAFNPVFRHPSEPRKNSTRPSVLLTQRFQLSLILKFVNRNLAGLRRCVEIRAWFDRAQKELVIRCRRKLVCASVYQLTSWVRQRPDERSTMVGLKRVAAHLEVTERVVGSEFLGPGVEDAIREPPSALCLISSLNVP